MAKEKKDEKTTADNTATKKTKTSKKADEALLKAQQETKEANEKLLRTLAEYDNFRKRSQKEKENAYVDSKADVLSALLPVLDNFERAAGNADTNLEDYKKGVEMIYNQLVDTFKKLGAESYGEPGDEFDPNIHNAVMHDEDAEKPENTITDVFSKGYRIGDKILRPAMVKVVN